MHAVTDTASILDGRVELMAGGRFQLQTRPGAGVTLRAMFRVSPAA